MNDPVPTARTWTHDEADRAVADYDAMMNRYSSARDDRFELMLDVLDGCTGAGLHIVELGCGPGSFTRRFLKRFPHATVVAVDCDPAMINLARYVLDPARTTIVERDITTKELAEISDSAPVDAVVLSSVTHYLTAEQIHDLYQRCNTILNHDGLVLNADEFQTESSGPVLDAIHARIRARRDADAAATNVDMWSQWWSRLGAQPVTAQQPLPLTPTAHCELLRSAGFDEAATIWQRDSASVLVAAVTASDR